MNNNIISAEEIKMEKFNSFVLSVDTLEKFLSYYMLVLQLAYDCEIISLQEREQINNWLLTVFTKKADGKAVLIANIMYVFSFYLLILPKQKALEELRSICSEDSANQCLMNADKFLNKFISRNRLKLDLVYSRLVSLKKSALIEVNKKLIDYLTNLSGYYYDEEINLKEMHKAPLSLNYFSLNQKRDYSNFFDKLEDAIVSFCYDVRIIKKLDGDKLFKFNNSLCRELEKKSEDEFKKIESFFEGKLSKLEEKYEKIKEKKDLDSFLLRQEYETKRLELLEQLSAKEDQFWQAKNHDDFNLKESVLFLEEEIPSVSYIIKEFALYYIVNQGFCKYPENEDMRLEIIENMSLSEAVNLLINAKELKLTEKEKEYLRNNTINL